MTTVDVLAALPAPATATTAGRKQHGDGFARELEVAAREDARGDDRTARTKASDQSRAAEQGRRAHDLNATTRRAHGAGTDARAVEAENPGSAADAGAASNSDVATALATNDGATADGTTTDTAGADGTTTDTAGADGTVADGAAAGAAIGVAAALAAATTDSVGLGTSSSGEASQDPAVTSILASATTVAAGQVGAQADASEMGVGEKGADAQATSTGLSASNVPEGATSPPHVGVTSPRSVETDAAKAAGSTTREPADSGKVPAGPVAVVGASSGDSGEQGVAQGELSGGRARTAGKATSDVAGATVAAASAQATTGVEKPDAAVTAATPVAPTAPAAATNATPGVAPIDAGLQVTAPTPVPQASASQPALPVPLSTQLTGQLTSLRQLPQGEHILTLTVNPETFGPVKVVAHITQHGVSLELFGASDQARAALKAALPDLRRDLAGAGLEPHLELGSGSGSGAGGRGAMGDSSSFAGNGNTPQRPAHSPLAGSAPAAASTSAPNATRRGGLDLVL